MVAEASMLFVGARAALKLLPFRRVAERLGAVQDVRRSSDALERPPTSRQRIAADSVAWIVPSVARGWTGEDTCLPQAITARMMLRRRGVPSVLHIGIAKDGPSAVAAHAWLEAAGTTITGGSTAVAFTEISRIV